MKYEFFTPYHRGFDLVFDFVRSQPNCRFERAPWSIEARYGYERSRDVRVFAEDQYVGTAHSIGERFAPLADAYRQFMCAVETAATEWQAAEQVAKEAVELQSQQRDAELCERVLAASGMSAGTAETTGSAGTEGSATAKPGRPTPTATPIAEDGQ